jgi:hypothetical protein
MRNHRIVGIAIPARAILDAGGDNGPEAVRKLKPLVDEADGAGAVVDPVLRSLGREQAHGQNLAPTPA